MVQVKLSNGKSCEIEWEDGDHTVKELRELISKKMDGLDLSGSRMVHRGQVMEDDAQTSKYGITMSSVIFVVIKNNKSNPTASQPVVTEEDSDNEEKEKSQRNTQTSQNPQSSATTSQPPFGGFPNLFAGLGGGGAGGMSSFTDMMGNRSQMMSALQDNPLFTQMMQDPMYMELISNPKFMNLTRRLMSDPLVSSCFISGDMSAMARPDVAARTQQIMMEEMPEFYNMVLNRALGQTGGMPFGQWGANGGLFGSPSAPQQRSPQPVSSGSGFSAERNDNDEESDDALDGIYGDSAASDKPFNSLGQRDAINDFITKMMEQKGEDNGSSAGSVAMKDTESAKTGALPNSVQNRELSQEELKEKYKKEIETLHSMGFFDDARAVNLLHLTGGDVNATVDRLLGDM